LTKQYSGEAFKRSIIRYAFGRIFNALLGFAVFVWIAKELPAAEYAIYVAAFALLEVGLVVAGLGMEWVTGVFVSQVRLNASGRQLREFIWECAAIQAATLLLVAGVQYLLAPLLSEWFRLSGADGAIRMYALVMFVEGVSRVFRDQLLSCLLLQGAAQLSQLARNITLLPQLWMNGDKVYEALRSHNAYETWLGNWPKVGLYLLGKMTVRERYIFMDYIHLGGPKSGYAEMAALTPCAGR